MSGISIQRDLGYLAGELPHRGANTESERAAAEYILKRFQECTPDAEIDDFYSIDSYLYLFGSYYAEFLVVSLLASWWPRIALCYGALVFLAYLGEFLGYPAFSRLLPRLETQNVIARLAASRPQWLFVVSAHYDSPREAAFAHPRFVPWLHRAHQAIVLCMLLVLITCATQAVGLFANAVLPINLVARWIAASLLLGAASVLFYSSLRGEFVRGANGNASGVAALLELAERFAQAPLEKGDVWFLATGSKTTWMNGMRHFLKRHTLDPATTFFLVMEHVGAGRLHYLTGEGMLHVFPAAAEQRRAAEAVAEAHGATPYLLRAVPTDALIPMARGYKATSVVALSSDGVPVDWHWHTDRLNHVDEALIQKAADFTEALLRRLEMDLS